MSPDAQRQSERTSYVASQGYDPMKVEALPADASARSYSRLSGGEAPRLLMDTPPGSPDFVPFIAIAKHLGSLGFSTPRIDSFDDARGFAILEDFGHNTFKRLLDQGHDEKALYQLAVDTLIALHETPRASEINVPAYDREPLVSELEMFTDWYVPVMLSGQRPAVFKKQFIDLWCDALKDCAASRETLVLRDFHVDNLMVIAGRSGVASCGLLDFQDALIGPAAYDLVSLLQDARRDLSPGLEDDLLHYYLDRRSSVDATQFIRTYWLLGAHRHTKIAGNFERLSKRDGKHGYLIHIPRVLRLLDKAMDKAGLSDIRQCLDLHIPNWKNWPHAQSRIFWKFHRMFDPQTPTRFLHPTYLPMSAAAQAVIDPATLETVGHIAESSSLEIENTLDRLNEAQRGWKKLDAKSRAKILHKVASAIEAADMTRCADLMTREMGKPYPEAIGEVANCAPIFRYYAEMARDDAGKVAGTTQAGSFQYMRYEPLGVSVHIMPFNFPILLMCWTVAASLAAGNACVVKPALATTLSTLEFMKVFEALPAGLIACLPGGAGVAEHLLKSPKTHAVAFTGSVAAGKAVAMTAAAHMKPAVIEAGGSDPMIITASAPIDVAAAGAVTAAFHLSGQVCTSAERFYVVDSVHDEFVAAFKRETLRLRIGNGLDHSEIGPLVSEAARAKVMRLIDDAVSQGARIVTGGKIPPALTKGWFYEPTILTNCTHDMAIMKEECFGPVAAIMRVPDFDAAIDMANASAFGLGSSIFTTDLAEAMEAAERLEAGMVWINNPLIDNDALPFGGSKMSGLGRELGRQGLDAFRRTKMVIMDHKPVRQDWWYPYPDTWFRSANGRKHS